MIMITPLPGVTTTKPGSATKPFPGIERRVVDEQTARGRPRGGGYLALTRPWPAMLRGIYGDPERYVKQYWSKYPASTSPATAPSSTTTATSGCSAASTT
jgi:acetyl-CoA synthetase